MDYRRLKSYAYAVLNILLILWLVESGKWYHWLIYSILQTVRVLLFVYKRREEFMRYIELIILKAEMYVNQKK